MSETGAVSGGVAAAEEVDAAARPSSLETVPGQEGERTDAPRLGGERPRVVPYGALAEERARRKELQRELRASFEARQELQDLVTSLRQPEASPRDQTDVAESQHGEETGEGLARAEHETENAFRTQVLQSVRHYARERPDFLDAYQHARNARIGELSLLGYSEVEAAAITFDNELELIQNAYAAGLNPAQIIYDYAVGRGFRTTGAAMSRPQSPVASPVPGPLSEAEKVALAARGQAGSKSLSSAGGGVVGGLSLEALANLSDEEFAEATRGDRWQRLLRS